MQTAHALQTRASADIELGSAALKQQPWGGVAVKSEGLSTAVVVDALTVAEKNRRADLIAAIEDEYSDSLVNNLSRKGVPSQIEAETQNCHGDALHAAAIFGSTPGSHHSSHQAPESDRNLWSTDSGEDLLAAEAVVARPAGSWRALLS